MARSSISYRSKWKLGQTTVIRVPQKLASALLRYARELDQKSALYMVNWYSSCDWQFTQLAAMTLPSIASKLDWLLTKAAGFLLRRVARQPLVQAQAVAVLLEHGQLSLQVRVIPRGLDPDILGG